MSRYEVSAGKQERLRRLSMRNGVIGALAIDQRKSLRRMIAQTAGVAVESVSDEQLVAFKRVVSEVLSGHASAILFDTEYGLEGAEKRARDCGLLLAYEADGYENPRPSRMLALMPDLSVERMAEMKADGVKILLHYSPDDPKEANDEKFAMIERIGAECAALELPFFLEPVAYDPTQPLVQSEVPPNEREEQAFTFAKRKPQIVVEMMREFSRDRYRVDILKVEFPVVAAYVQGSRTCRERVAYTMDEAMEWYRTADEAATRPYIYLSAGVSHAEFLESLRLALEAESRFCGVLCGRATWQEGVPEFVARGEGGFRRWLETTGVANLEALNAMMEHATPWDRFEAAKVR